MELPQYVQQSILKPTGIMELMPILLNTDEDLRHISPSSFLAEMKLTTEQRVERLKKTKRLRIIDAISSKTFRVSPKIVIFQNFTPSIEHAVVVSLTNCSRSSKPLKIDFEKNPYFSMSFVSEVALTKIASGLTLQIAVKFCPTERRDYRHQIAFRTQDETFIVPIIGIGPRPLLDIPDFIMFETSPVGLGAEKKFLVRNLGPVPAVFSLNTKPPFSVVPTRGVLAPYNTMHLVVKYNSPVVGSTEGLLVVNYETGEKLSTKLYGTTGNLDVVLEKKVVKFEDTYVDLKRDTSFSIRNNSDHVVRFVWKAYENLQRDVVEGEKMKEAFWLVKEHETKRNEPLSFNRILDDEDNALVYERIYQDELQDFERNEQFKYCGSVFQIIPADGEIWPKSSTNITVIFSPEEVGMAEKTVYCQITGVENRIPLLLKGFGKGPWVELNVENIKICEICLETHHDFEVAVRNKGDIPATIKYVPTMPNFGGVFSCEPEEITVEPMSYGDFTVEYIPDRKGKFVEVISFEVAESQEILSFSLEGTVVCPMLKLDVESIEFGTISLGHYKTVNVMIMNDSKVQVPYYVFVSPDGSSPSVTCHNFAESYPEVTIPENPQEFSFFPERGVLPPSSSIMATLTMLPNRARKNAATVLAEVWGSPQVTELAVITFNAVKPEIAFDPDEFHLRFCYVDVVYQKVTTIRNLTDYQGFIVIEQTEGEDAGMEITTNVKSHFIQPRESLEVLISVTNHVMGDQEQCLSVVLFGDDVKKFCKIKCSVEGPFISIIPHILPFGEVELLVPVTKEVTVINDSPVSAEINSSTGGHSPWSVVPENITLLPANSVTLAVTVVLMDEGTFHGKLVCSVKNCKEYICTLSAVGIGASITTDPVIAPVLNLESILTKTSFQKEIRFINNGSRNHRIILSQRRLSILKTTKAMKSVIEFSPKDFEVKAHKTVPVILKAMSDEAQFVEEIFHCHAQIGKDPRKKTLFTSVISANFVEPMMDFSKMSLNFVVDRNTGDARQNTLDNISITNRSPMVMTVELNTTAPFYLLDDVDEPDTSMSKILKEEETMQVYIQFNPDGFGKKSRLVENNLIISYSNHPMKTKVPLRAEVNFPAVSISPTEIKFGCIPSGSHGTREVLICNVSPFPVSYNWEWVKESIKIEKLSPVESRTPDLKSYASFGNLLEVAAGEESLLPSVIALESTADVEALTPELNIEIAPVLTLEEEMSQILFPVVGDYLADETELETFKYLRNNQNQGLNINEIFCVFPLCGFLMPGESQVTSIGFHPLEGMKVSARAACVVDGGDTQYLDISGMASNIAYEISRTSVDFGRQVFGELVSREIILKNIGFLPFDYEAKPSIQRDMSKSGSTCGWMTIHPKKGNLDADGKVQLQVQYSPGITGMFSETFELRIGYLKPLEINVRGFGSFPQVYLSLPRPAMEKVDPELCFTAVATITHSWQSDSKDNKESQWKHSDIISEHNKLELGNDGWEIITRELDYPSRLEIELAIERMLVTKAYEDEIIRITDPRKKKGLLDIAVPPYFLDFGHVIANTIQHFSVLIWNYGPSAVSLRPIMPSGTHSFSNSGFNLQFKGSSLQEGQTIDMHFIFHPRELEEETHTVNSMIYLEVLRSLKIPISIYAVVTVPKIEPSTNVVDFGTVTCGTCVMQQIVLTNSGPIPCVWRLTLPKPIKGYGSAKCSKPNFFMTNSKGEAEPGEQNVANVYFMPRCEGPTDAIVTLTMNQNRKVRKIRLKGIAVTPGLKITEPQLTFGPCLPYDRTAIRTFAVENTSDLPVEFYFSDFDKEVDHEIQLLNTVSNFYHDDIFLPLRKPGAGLPQEVMAFYSSVSEDANNRLLNRQRPDDGVSMASSAESGGSRKKRRASAKSLSMDSTAKPTPSELLRCINELVEEMKNSQRVKDIIETQKPEASLLSPVIFPESPPIEEPQANIMKHGFCFIFHGAPYTDHVYQANKFAKEMKLPALSIDSLILESLAYNKTYSALRVNEMIDKYFFQLGITDSLTELKKTSASNTSIMFYINAERRAGSDPIEEVMKKIEKLCEIAKDGMKRSRDGLKEKDQENESQIIEVKKKDSSFDIVKKGGSKASRSLVSVKSKKSKKSKSSDSLSGKSKSDRSSKSKKSKKSSKSAGSAKSEKISREKQLKELRQNMKGDIFLNIPQDVLLDILSSKLLELQPGVVIETLNSAFIKKPLAALNMLLQAAGNISFIHAFVLHKNYDEYAKAFETSEKIETLRSVKSGLTVEQFHQMTEEEVLALTPEELEQIKKLIVEDRKQASKKRSVGSKKTVSGKENGSTKRKKSPKKQKKPLAKGSPKKKGKKGNSSESSVEGKPGESPKKKKKSKSSSSEGSPRGKKGKEPSTPEEKKKKKTFSEYEALLCAIMHMLEYWDKNSRVVVKKLAEKNLRGVSKGKKPSGKSAETINLAAFNQSFVVESAEEIKTSKIGIPLMIVKEALAPYTADVIRSSPEYCEAWENLALFLGTGIIPITEEYTVYPCHSAARARQTSEYFTLSSQDTENITQNSMDTSEINLKSALSMKSFTSGSKRRTSLKKTKTRRQSSDSFSDTSADSISKKFKLNPRSVLSPGEKLYFRVAFLPKSCGKFTHAFNVDVVGSSNNYEVNCIGNCDIPKIDYTPEKLFRRTFHNRNDKTPNDPPAFIIGERVLDFGNILLRHYFKEGSDRDRVDLRLHNVSDLPCHLSAVFMEDSSTFILRESSIVIEPHSLGILVIYAEPTQIGLKYNTLVLTVKNNPEVHTVYMECQGVKLDFNISHKVLSFERTLTGQRISKTVLFENHSLIPVTWKFTNAHIFADHFMFSTTREKVPAQSQCHVTITFRSAHEIVLTPKNLNVEVYNKSSVSTPILSETIEISAEAYISQVEYSADIDFGDIKSGVSYDKPFSITNQAKYNCEFSTVMQEQPPGGRYASLITKSFSTNPTKGTIQPKKTASPVVTFSSNREIVLNRMPVFQCSVTDPYNNGLIVSFPVVVSLRTFYSQYEISPPTFINIGPVPFGNQKSFEATIRNSGKFDFQYTITCKSGSEGSRKRKKKKGSQLEVGKKRKRGSKKGSKKGSRKGSRKGKAKKTSRKGSLKSPHQELKKKPRKGSSTIKVKKARKSDSGSSASVKSKKKKKKGSVKSLTSNKSVEVEKRKQTKLVCGHFTVHNTTGVIKAQDKQTFQVVFNASEEGLFEDILNIVVSECSPKDKEGTNIKIFAQSVVPDIDFSPETLFEEHYIVDTLENYSPPKEIGAHCVYSLGEEKLVFKRVPINTTASIRLHINNKSLVGTEVFASTSPPFSITPEKTNIDSYTNGFITLSFTPSKMEVYRSEFKMCLKLPPPLGERIVTFRVEGEGEVPQIEILEPAEGAAIRFLPTLKDHTTAKSIKIKNCGNLPCKVIVEIVNDYDHVYMLKLLRETLSMISRFEPDKGEAEKHVLLDILIDRTAELELTYTPIEVAKSRCFVRVHVVNNPYEHFQFAVYGTSYAEDVVLLGLPTRTRPSRGSISSNDSSNISCCYDINFGTAFLDSLQHLAFKIQNFSEKDIFKFSFQEHRLVTFMPRVGHLKPLATKDVLATFFTKLPYTANEELLGVAICKIEYVNPEHEQLSWDDRQELVVWKDPIVKPSIIEFEDIEEKEPEKKIKQIQESSEPEITVIPGTISNLCLVFNVVSDYSSFECDIVEVNFPDTIMFEKREFPFPIHNPGKVPVEIMWNVTMDEYFPRRIVYGRLQSLESDLKIPFMARMKRQHKPTPLTGDETFYRASSDKSDNESASTLFSEEAALSNRTSDSWTDHNQIPLYVSTPKTVIQPGETEFVKIIFAPLDAYSYKACLRTFITNLSPNLDEMNLRINANSIMPYCHFDVKLGDYLSNGQRVLDECRDPACYNVKVIEFNCLGIGSTYTRKFNVINPTSENFSFKWVMQKSDTHANFPLFVCNTPKGTIIKGKQTEVSFSVMPQKTGTFEAFFEFEIPKFSLTSNFLLVAFVREPNVYFLNPHINLKTTVLGISVSDYAYIRNNENIDFSFEFTKESFFAEGKKQLLYLKPRKGFLTAQSETKIKITFEPTKVGESNFLLKCKVDRLRNHLSLGLRTLCYDVKPKISYISSNGDKNYLDYNKPNVIELQYLVPLKTEKIKFNIFNLGKTGFYYVWSVPSELSNKYFKLEFRDKDGYVKHTTEIQTTLTLTPLKNMSLKNFKISLQIPYGPSYQILLNGSAISSLFTFSFLKYDFGMTFITKANPIMAETFLGFTSNDVKPLLLENRDKGDGPFVVHIKSVLVPPKQTIPIRVTFLPVCVGEVRTDMEFLVNSRPVSITLMGEGVEHNVILEDPNDKYINLGSPKIDEVVVRKFKVVNESAKAVTILVDIWDKLPEILSSAKNEVELLSEPEMVETKREPKSAATSERESSASSKKSTRSKRSKKSKKSKSSSSKSSRSRSHSSSGKKKKKEKLASRSSESKTESSIKLKTKKKKKKKILAGGDTTDGSSSKSRSSSSSSSGSSRSKKSRKKKNKKKKSKKTKKPKSTDSIPEEKDATFGKSETKKPPKEKPEVLSIEPKVPIKIRPKGKAKITIRFTPKERMKPFTEKIAMLVNNSIEPLCLVAGSCLGPEFALDRDSISFGTVVKGSYNDNKVILLNSGDMGSKFEWVCPQNNKDYNIHPSEGYCTVGMNITFNVRFEPQNVRPASTVVFQCMLENYPPLILVLSGNSTDLPSPVSTIRFSCPVRKKDTKKIPLSNDKNELMEMTPSMSGSYFSGPENLIVEARSTETCEIEYCPLTITRDNSFHMGTAFFRQPDGMGLLYALEGQALPPEPEKSIDIEVPCKKTHVETLVVSNWLRISQQFRVKTASYSDVKTAGILYKISGPEYIDVIGHNERQYDWIFYSYKEGQMKFKVTFTNESTGEYLFFEINVKVTPGEPIKNITLKTCCRTPITYFIPIENPLKIPAHISIECNAPDVAFEKSLIIDPLTKVEIPFEFFPLLSGYTRDEIIIDSPELGPFIYDVKLEALPAPDLPALVLTAPLGSTDMNKAKVVNLTNALAAFTTKMDESPVFRAKEFISVPANESGEIEVTFEPNEMGKFDHEMRIFSPTAGTYSFPLVGYCTQPKPQGPYSVKEDDSVEVPFRNPLNTPELFRFFIDNDSFTLTTHNATVNSKDEYRIVINFNSIESEENRLISQYDSTGKLIVVCDTERLEGVKWVFYLQGIPAPEKPTSKQPSAGSKAMSKSSSGRRTSVLINKRSSQQGSLRVIHNVSSQSAHPIHPENSFQNLKNEEFAVNIDSSGQASSQSSKSKRTQ